MIVPTPASLRLGLLVAAALAPAQADAVGAPLTTLLAYVAGRVGAIAADPAARHVHGDVAPALHCVATLRGDPAGSGHAGGRAAAAALAASYSLSRILPHGLDTSIDPEASLIARAMTRLCMDASAGLAPERSLQAANHIVIRHANLLMAM